MASRIGISERYVRKLIRDERLEATKPGREWLVDDESVIELEALRSRK